jgi:hypothetical protein
MTLVTRSLVIETGLTHHLQGDGDLGVQEIVGHGVPLVLGISA